MHFIPGNVIFLSNLVEVLQLLETSFPNRLPGIRPWTSLGNFRPHTLEVNLPPLVYSANTTLVTPVTIRPPKWYDLELAKTFTHYSDYPLLP